MLSSKAPGFVHCISVRMFLLFFNFPFYHGASDRGIYIDYDYKPPRNPRFAGSNPAEVHGFFSRRINPKHKSSGRDFKLVKEPQA